MFREETVLVLGAGASAPYEFPLGHQLVRQIRLGLMGEGNKSFFNLIKLEYDTLVEELKDLLVDFDPASIDAFLEMKRNHKYLDLGKACIAAVLLPKEHPDLVREIYAYNEHHWYGELARLILERAHSLEDVCANKLSIITYNYDRSLEYYLAHVLRVCCTLDIAPFWDEVSNAIPIVHVHGQLGPLPWQVPPTVPENAVPYACLRDSTSKSTNVSRRWLNLATSGIKIIHEGEDNTEELKESRRLLRSATRIFFLGFGFNQTNIDRLRLQDTTAYAKATVHELGYDSIHRVMDITRKPTRTNPMYLFEDHPFRLDYPQPKGRIHNHRALYDYTVSEFIQKVGITTY